MIARLPNGATCRVGRSPPSKLGSRASRVVAALLVTGCVGPSSGASVGLEISTQGLTSGVSAFQLALVFSPQGSYCPSLNPNTCLNQQVNATQLVPLFSAQGQQTSALLVAASATALDGGTQDVVITAQVGKSDTLVIEEISQSDTLLGTSCTYLPNGIEPGDNGIQLAQPMQTVNAVPMCDPLYE
jgi:hypothetical protein